jgi:hypothetical protein
MIITVARDIGDRREETNLEGKPDGTYPEGTVNWGVQTRLHELAEKVKAFTMREKTSEDGRGQREKAQLKD